MVRIIAIFANLRTSPSEASIRLEGRAESAHSMTDMERA